MNEREVIIIGAGPAGIAAAIQCRRMGLEPLIFEKSEIGGLLRNANLVENYPGFPVGIKGVDLVNTFKQQLAVNRIEVVPAEVTGLDFKNDLFSVMAGGKTILSKRVIVAIGTKPVQTELEIPQPAEGLVFYEVYPLLDRRDDTITIIGAGDAAFDYALSLGQSNDVIIINRGEITRCLPLLVQCVSQSNRIRYWSNTTVTEIDVQKNGKLDLTCRGLENSHQIESDYLIYAIGRQPEQLHLSDAIGDNSARLMAERRLFFIGDIINGRYRQTSIAVADGVKAAMQIYEAVGREDK